ncbi:scavenger receptor class B member 1 isoform X2 [Callorhinchus milii]|uniref:scavenger receptor class B member 1 isoform X2 n=1 Tax=Callorhinchus milii TaxID=7868 RepID=UPI001C3F5CD4|nr:scavenger receptor class B member 1 isoform X2 [Callorhinchus milii]
MSSCGWRALLALAVTGVLLTTLGVTLIFINPIIMRDQVIKNVQIDPSNSLAYPMWRDVPVPFYMAVHFFEILNPEGILRGEQPALAQRGPYVYREYRPKDNITFNDNYTVSYRSIRQFHFCAERSAGSESDELVLPNMLALGGALMAENLSPLMKLIFNDAMTQLNQTLFFRKTVREILWGYNDPLIDLLNSIFPGMISSNDKFGLFAEMNNTDTGLFTVNTGLDHINKIHQLDKWNGNNMVSYWNSTQCNMINGTAGEMWSPFRTPSDTLKFYSPDACRSLELVYERSSTTLRLPSFRYVAPKTMFANGQDYPPNQGFCPCRESGAMNASTCRLSMPSFLSHPHFFNGDPALSQAVAGLNPTEEEHGLFIDIHPLTGVPLNVSIKLQLNLFTKEVKGIKITGKMRTLLLPLIWFDESGRMDGPIVSTFYHYMVVVPALLQALQYVLLVVGFLLVITSFALALHTHRQRKRHSPFSSHQTDQ